jgi:hypothetical protein
MYVLVGDLKLLEIARTELLILGLRLHKSDEGRRPIRGEQDNTIFTILLVRQPNRYTRH